MTVQEGTGSLVWLVRCVRSAVVGGTRTSAHTTPGRTLNLILLGLRRNLADPREELSTSLTKAYETTLKPHHAYLVRPVFYVSLPHRHDAVGVTPPLIPEPTRRAQMAMKSCPYRRNFYPRLGTPQEVVLAELERWLDGLDRVTKRCGEIFKEGGYGKRY